VIAGYKHSSLLGLVVSDEEKKFYNIDSYNFPVNYMSELLYSTGPWVEKQDF
jgi:hypothetical protein